MLIIDNPQCYLESLSYFFRKLSSAQGNMEILYWFLMVVVGSSIVASSVEDDFLEFLEDFDEAKDLEGGQRTMEWRGYMVDENRKINVDLKVDFEKCCEGIISICLNFI